MPELIPIREALARAVLGRLRADLAPVRVERNLRDAVQAEEAPIVTFIEGGHTADQPDFGETSYEMEVPIEATVSAETGADLGFAINDLYGRVIKSLMADPTLGGLCVQLSERSFDPRVISVEESEKPLCVWALSIIAEFRVQDGSPIPFVDANAPPPGATTPARPPTGSAFRHVQAEPSDTWVIRHGMGQYPNVVVVDTAGRRIYPGGERYPDENTLILGFGVPLAGTADLD